jgi:pimeloyl-ACP methyl ester carboxylesterase
MKQQAANTFDVVIAETASGTSPGTGIVFLHGFGGNFTVQCWLIARAGYQIDAVTVCPSTDPSGYWWNLQGQSIVQETLRYMRQRGVERIYLAGLSNGGIGASRLADQFENDLAGLILISGADPNATITSLPVLLLHGKHDERIPVSVMEQYSFAVGPGSTHHVFDGDHFLLLKQTDRVQETLVDWLRQQELDSERTK